jgi:hypothetical protein
MVWISLKYSINIFTMGKKMPASVSTRRHWLYDATYLIPGSTRVGQEVNVN